MRITLHRNAVHVAVAVVTVLTGAAGCTIPVVQTTTSVASSPTPANPSVMQPTTSPTTKTLSSSSPTRETKPSTTAEPSPKTYELANRSVTERLLLSGYPPTSPIVSPDGKRVAYFGKVESVRYHTVVVDSVEGKYYDNIDFQTLTFSPDSKHVAYFASFYSDKKYSLVVDGVEGQHYDRGDRVGGDSAMFPLGPEAVFSPDGQHVAYAAKLGNDSFVVADGVEGKHYLQIVSAPIYSPDSKHLAYAVQKQSTERATVKDGRVVIEGEPGGVRIVLDGVESKPYTGVKFKSLVFSPDSQRLAFIAKESDLNGERVVVDGVLSPDCEEYNYVLSLVFSPDSRRVAYYAKLAVDRTSSVCPIRPFELGAFDYLVVDGVEKRMRWSVQGTNMWDLNRGIFFTPDSKQVVYMTQLSMVTDGEERALEPPPDLHSLPVWNADWSRLAYVSYGTDAQGKSVQSLVVDGLKGKDYATVSGTEFTPDGKHFAYLVTDAENKKSFVVVDGVEGERYDSVMLNSTFMPTIEERIRLFDSSERLHYVAWRDRSLYLVEETLK